VKKANRVPESAVLSKSNDVLSRKNFDGSVAVLHLLNDEYFFTLDGIAAEFWTMIDGRTPLDEIKSRLIEKHKPPVKRFEADVQKLITNLRNKELIL
jgi:hypothetical protein